MVACAVTRSAHVWAVGVGVVFVLATSVAQAQPRGGRNGSNNDETEAQHAQGNRLREQGRHAEARDLFRALYERTQDPRALVRQGLAEMALQEWIAADEHLTAGLATQGNRWVDENRARINGALHDVQTHVGSLAVECGPAGATLTVNDTARGVCPVSAPLRLAVGSATVRVEAPGQPPRSETVQVVAGSEPLRVRVVVDPPAPPPPPTPTVNESLRRRRRTMLALGGVSLGLGAAGVGVGLAGFTALDNNTVGLVGVAAGGALLVTGVVLLVVAPSRRDVEGRAALCAPTFDRPGLACAVTF